LKRSIRDFGNEPGAGEVHHFEWYSPGVLAIAATVVTLAAIVRGTRWSRGDGVEVLLE
jgi:hypothetical protein